MKDVVEYLRKQNVEVDEVLLKYIERGTDITDKDEFKHDFGNIKYPDHHNESWYFNFIDFNAKVQMVTRTAIQMGKKEGNMMLLLIIDRKSDPYFNIWPIIGFPEGDVYGDKKVKYECLEPMKKWRITHRSRKYELDVIFEQRFPVFHGTAHQDPLDVLKKYGVRILEVAAQQHYEQAMKVTGVFRRKQKREVIEERQIDCLGYRDHSWGTRDWVNIDRWNWMEVQFPDSCVCLSRVEVFGKVIAFGSITTDNGHELIEDVNVETAYGYEGKEKAPSSSTFRCTTPNRNIKLVSKTWKSLQLQRPTESGLVEIYEQIAEFEMDGKKGLGISEYMNAYRK